MPAFANWRTLLTIVALIIVTGTIFYSNYLADKIAANERQIVEGWAEAHRYIASAGPDDDITFASVMISSQQTIPVIETNEKDSITNFHNIDSADVSGSRDFLQKKIREFSKNGPIITYLGNDSAKFNKYYYGESRLLKEVRYYPFVQLFIVALFILVTMNALNARHKAMQNQLWAGMAKETAHQLGTPVSALHGWVEMLRETGTDKEMVNEIEKDVIRLKLVSDRFSKIGSTPHLEQHNLVDALRSVMEYVRKRATDKVKFVMDTEKEVLMVPLSNPLFDWVVENLLKNALDAMEGKGEIRLHVHEHAGKVVIDISDTGKGMSSSQIGKVFNPGFTTKKRGWGLGLTLSKRIIEDYHKGQLVVKHSEIGKGTTFRITIPSG
ncbi:MAG TPA: HAMP domain-containing sensor histidine kinase [Chitinophagaceae bacterium]|nr:HAMP domain-containing sensor histidine kinase [Chitinophagaceae bacterium]